MFSVTENCRNTILLHLRNNLFVYNTCKFSGFQFSPLCPVSRIFLKKENDKTCFSTIFNFSLQQSLILFEGFFRLIIMKFQFKINLKIFKIQFYFFFFPLKRTMEKFLDSYTLLKLLFFFFRIHILNRCLLFRFLVPKHPAAIGEKLAGMGGSTEVEKKTVLKKS